jgi:hypothetical protein
VSKSDREIFLAHLNSAVGELRPHFEAMEACLAKPILVSHGFVEWFRYKQQNDVLLCFLKGIKIVSTLNAAVILLEKGFNQEVGALCRIVDDCCNDVMFMCLNLQGEPDKQKMQFFNDFFQEEFDDVRNPLDSRRKREPVRRKAIHAAFGNAAKGILNPSDSQKAQYVIHGAMSGYIHGAYPHIMELYSGSPPTFHMEGVKGTERECEIDQHFSGTVHRAIMTSELVSKRIGNPIIVENIRATLLKFESDFNYKIEDPNMLIQKGRNRP